MSYVCPTDNVLENDSNVAIGDALSSVKPEMGWKAT